jgi:hypothetical protein
LIPAVPEIDQFMAPVGATAFVAPVSVAVQSKEPPKVVEPDAERVMDGRGAVTTVEFEEVTVATEK